MAYLAKDSRRERFLQTFHHPPLLFVRFEFDEESVVATRVSLFASIPGPKIRWDFPDTNRSLNARGRARIVAGDTMAASLLSSRLVRFIAELRSARSNAIALLPDGRNRRDFQRSGKSQ